MRDYIMTMDLYEIVRVVFTGIALILNLINITIWKDIICVGYMADAIVTIWTATFTMLAGLMYVTDRNVLYSE